jgi:hypothetical protein
MRGESRAIGHVHTPDACATPEVKYPLGVGNGGEVELVIKQHQEHVVRNVELVILDFLKVERRVSISSQRACSSSHTSLGPQYSPSRYL